MFNSYEMSQFEEGKYLPIMLEFMFIGIGELHLTNKKKI